MNWSALYIERFSAFTSNILWRISCSVTSMVLIAQYLHSGPKWGLYWIRWIRAPWKICSRVDLSFEWNIIAMIWKKLKLPTVFIFHFYHQRLLLKIVCSRRKPLQNVWIEPWAMPIGHPFLTFVCSVDIQKEFVWWNFIQISHNCKQLHRSI